jgi:hypothetical protein
MKAGVDEAAFVGAVCHNKFINQIIHFTGTLADDGNQGDAVAKARLYERLQQARVRYGQLQDDLSSIGHVYAISEMGLVRQQFA